MGRKEDGELGGICGYAKARYEERVEERRRKRSHSEGKEEVAAAVVPRKLHKAPQIQTLYERPERNRLRRKSVPLIESQVTQKRRNNNLYVLEFDPYPYDTQPRQYMGAYSTINRVTAGAFEHGAYTFSKEGLLDGSEYLSPTGRIRIISLPVIRTGSRVTIAERSKSSNGEEVRLDIPHPESQNNEATKDQSKEKTSAIAEDAKRVIFLAVRQGANNSSCIGIYSEKSLAWGACLKDKAMCAQTYSLSEEIRSIGQNNMPYVTAMLAGSGRYTWLVEGHAVDGARPKRPVTEPIQRVSGTDGS